MNKKDIYPLGQALVFALRAMKTHASIVSGAYKGRRVSRGLSEEEQATIFWAIHGFCSVCGLQLRDGGTCACGVEWTTPLGKTALEPRWMKLTDEELLQGEINTMGRHIEFVEECINTLLQGKE